MFGYVSVNPQGLSEAERKRFRGFYCGLCHVLRERYGDIGRLTLSHDMTFLSLLLAALYEPEEKTGEERCALHPLKPHPVVLQAAAEYAADMNIILAYYKCMDDAQDEGSLRGRAGRVALQKAFEQAAERWPTQSGTVQASLERLAALERQESNDLDALARLAGDMLGACFPWKQDAFAPYLRDMGAALGRFVYLMDAYEDYDADEKRGRFNPLRMLHSTDDYEARMEEILTMEMAQCTQAFSLLPIEQDLALINNVLYSGVWGRYARLTEKRKEKQA
ncbi:MAG: hypothetical protein IJ214_08535 [Clostridia bacterium]|nr:hypothetical protein [Clostridia bacterium]